jgi:hypothetical protein
VVCCEKRVYCFRAFVNFSSLLYNKEVLYIIHFFKK